MQHQRKNEEKKKWKQARMQTKMKYKHVHEWSDEKRIFCVCFYKSKILAMAMVKQSLYFFFTFFSFFIYSEKEEAKEEDEEKKDQMCEREDMCVHFTRIIFYKFSTAKQPPTEPFYAALRYVHFFIIIFCSSLTSLCVYVYAYKIFYLGFSFVWCWFCHFAYFCLLHNKVNCFRKQLIIILKFFFERKICLWTKLFQNKKKLFD